MKISEAISRAEEIKGAITLNAPLHGLKQEYVEALQILIDFAGGKKDGRKPK